MIALASVLTKIPFLWRLVTYAVVALSLWGGFKYWKHSIYQDGFRAGEVRVQDEWNASVRREIEDGNAARVGADDDIDRAGPSGVSDDPRNRDNWKAGKPGG
jgi:hypothetical protein